MFVTNDPDLYETVLTLSNHGRARGQKKQFWPDMVGFKYKMSNIQAAIGCAQLERIDDLINEKVSIFGHYASCFAGRPVAMNPCPEQCQNGYWMPTIVLEEQLWSVNIENVILNLRENGIDARVFFLAFESYVDPWKGSL